MKDMAIKPKSRKAHFKKCLEEPVNQHNPKKRLIKILTTPSAPVVIPAPSIEEKVAVPEVSVQPTERSFFITLPLPGNMPVLIQDESPREVESIPEIAEIARTEEPQVVETPKEEIKEEVTVEESVDSPLVKQLIAMGFDKQKVDFVSLVCSDIESALEHLLNL